MSVIVNICGGKKESDEYNAALKLKEIIENTLPSNVIGEIALVVSATLFGQNVKDIDLIMLGMLQNYSPILSFYTEDEKDNSESRNRIEKKMVNIENFCTAIEVKKHDISGIHLEGTDFYVKYNGKQHNVTHQSNDQKYAIKKFLESQINYAPFITNVIWFTEIERENVNELLTNNGNRMKSNVIGADFNFKELMQLLVWQNIPKSNGKHYYLDCSMWSLDKLRDALKIFSKRKKTMGKLTRKRIEIISSQEFLKNQLVNTEGKVSICRGRAGTGKTVGLIQTAIHLVDENLARVLILTYNKALVSDIRRLFALAELPDLFEEKCVYVNTMHSYFFRLVNKVLYEDKLSGKKFIDNYNNFLNELNSFMIDDDSIAIVKEFVRSDSQLDWDYVLIDEAQDWTNLERDIILKIFEKGNIIVADGGNQFVRNIDPCNWSVVRERNHIKLKECLRQKENLVDFLNLFPEKLEKGRKIKSSGNMKGGKIVITTKDKLYRVHEEEMKQLLEVGNIAYDMLYLVPHSLVQKKGEEKSFSLKKEFEENSIFVWDGTNSDNRDNYSIASDEVRVLQYDSARGLEGWTVVCMDFDVFLREKTYEYVEEPIDRTKLKSPEEIRKEYLYNWAMIPLTRAIDTLVIVLSDKDSDVGKTLKSIADEHKDFVQWI